MDLQRILNKLKREDDCHKGSFGHILIIGGDHGMGGAVIMAAMAASRVGGAKITVLTRNNHVSAMLSNAPNIMLLDENTKIKDALKNKDVIAIGTGLGKSTWSKKIFNEVMKSNLPKVIDADALNLLALSRKKFNLQNCAITPHQGEAARLLEILSIKDKKSAIEELAKKFDTNVVLKGFHNLIKCSDQEIQQCQFGNSAMATAGMGDVLTGIVVGLMSQGLSSFEALLLGVNVHAIAGDMTARKLGKIGIVPMDLFEFLPAIVGGA